MDLDPRTPLGWTFIMIGATLSLFGMTTNADAHLYAPCLGINANLVWGFVLLLIGMFLVPFGHRGQRRREKP
jgi:hypothetical protein